MCPEEFKLAPTTSFQNTGVGNVILFANDSLLDFPLQLELPEHLPWLDAVSRKWGKAQELSTLRKCLWSMKGTHEAVFVELRELKSHETPATRQLKSA